MNVTELRKEIFTLNYMQGTFNLNEKADAVEVYTNLMERLHESKVIENLIENGQVITSSVLTEEEVID